MDFTDDTKPGKVVNSGKTTDDSDKIILYVYDTKINNIFQCSQTQGLQHSWS